MADNRENFDRENLHWLWQVAFDEVTGLIPKVMEHANFELIESRYGQDRQSITDGMHGILRQVHHMACNNVIDNANNKITALRTIDADKLQIKAEELRYEGPTPFILTALTNTGPSLYSMAQSRDFSVLLLSRGAEYEFALDDLPQQERTMFREFYADRYFDYALRASGFFDAAIASVLIGNDFETSVGVAAKVLAPFEGDKQIFSEYPNIENLRIPPKDLAVLPPMEEMIKHYTGVIGDMTLDKDWLDDQSSSQRWQMAFEDTAQLICKIVQQMDFQLIETRYSENVGFKMEICDQDGRILSDTDDFISLTEETRGHLKILYQTAVNAAKNAALIVIAGMKDLNPEQLEHKAAELGYENATPFVLSAILNANVREAYGHLQLRDTRLQWLVDTVDQEMGSSKIAYPFRAIHREFYSNRLLDYSLRARTFLDAAISATIMGRNLNKSIEAAKNIIDPFVDRSESLPSYSNLDSLDMPPRSNAIMSRMEYMIRHYTAH